MTAPTRIGLFGIGLEAYWPQFPGLKERLEGYLSRVSEKMLRPGVEVRLRKVALRTPLQRKDISTTIRLRRREVTRLPK